MNTYCKPEHHPRKLVSLRPPETSFGPFSGIRFQSLPYRRMGPHCGLCRSGDAREDLLRALSTSSFLTTYKVSRNEAVADGGQSRHFGTSRLLAMASPLQQLAGHPETAIPYAKMCLLVLVNGLRPSLLFPLGNLASLWVPTFWPKALGGVRSDSAARANPYAALQTKLAKRSLLSSLGICCEVSRAGEGRIS